MIDRKQYPVEGAVWMLMLQEAHEHLGNIIQELEEKEDGCDIDFGIPLGHVFGHLNRAWNGRNEVKEIDDSKWDEYSSFPKDITIT